jgi:hypothetical protein
MKKRPLSQNETENKHKATLILKEQIQEIPAQSA